MKVLIACGASGGHIFPAIALGGSLRRARPDLETLFVGSRRYLDMRIFRREGLAFRCLSSNKLPYRFSWALASFFVRLAFDCAKSALIIASFRPDAIVAFGGYVSFPLVIIGRISGIPTVAHEQNVRPGRANSLLFRCVDRIAVSFEETVAGLPPRARRKAVVTGNPIRTDALVDDRETALKEFDFDTNKFTILVVGGSQGSHRLNTVFAESIASLGSDTRRALQIIHIAGERDRQWVDRAYRACGIASAVFSFLDRINHAYSLADLVFTRSGAAALFEIAFYGKPMVLIPYPYTMSHQKENALVFSRKGAAIYRDERELSAQEVRALIEELMEDRERLETMGRASKALCVPDAALKLAEAVIGLSAFAENPVHGRG